MSCIDVDSERGIALTLTSERWSGDSYLWEQPDAIICSLLLAAKPGNGAFSDLVRAIHAEGKAVKVPTPLGLMERIVQAKGFTHTVEDSEMGACDVWVLLSHLAFPLARPGP